MEEETFFITEVDSDTEEKPLISNTHNKVKSNGKSAISNNIESTSHKLWLENSRKRRKSRSVSMAEKKLLAKLVEKEPALWDKNNELHFHGPALSAAWRRISEQMSGRGGNLVSFFPVVYLTANGSVIFSCRMQGNLEKFKGCSQISKKQNCENCRLF